MSAPQSDEQALVDTFIVPSKRARYRELLSNAKRRSKFLDGLNHLHDLDPRYVTPLAAGTDVVELLRTSGAPEQCHLISAKPDLDGRKMPLAEAVREMEVGMCGTLVGCVPGTLAYHYGEGGEQRVLLKGGS